MTWHTTLVLGGAPKKRHSPPVHRSPATVSNTASASVARQCEDCALGSKIHHLWHTPACASITVVVRTGRTQTPAGRSRTKPLLNLARMPAGRRLQHSSQRRRLDCASDDSPLATASTLQLGARLYPTSTQLSASIWRRPSGTTNLPVVACILGIPLHDTAPQEIVVGCR